MKKSKGFTALEVLFITSLVGVLTLVIVPTLSYSLNNAKSEADDACLKEAFNQASVSLVKGECEVGQKYIYDIETEQLISYSDFVTLNYGTIIDHDYIIVEIVDKTDFNIAWNNGDGFSKQ